MDGKAQAITDNIPDTEHIDDITHTHTLTHNNIFMLHSRHWHGEIIHSYFLSGKADIFQLKSI